MAGPYKDAVAGTPKAGEAIAGTWWAYPQRAALQLRGRTTNYAIVGAGPASVFLTAARAALTLVGRTADFKLSATVQPSRAALLLTGRPAVYANEQWMFPADCREIALTPLECR